MKPSYQPYTDNELACLLKGGDHAAYTEIYNRYSKALYLQAYQRLKDRELAKDIVQDLFATIWERRATFELNTQLAAYLYTAVRNRVIKVFAHKNVEAHYFASLGTFIEDQQDASDHLIRTRELEAHIDQEINALPEKMRAIFKLSRQGHLSHKEIAQVCNLSEATVKKQVNNALKVLRVKLGSFHQWLLLFLP